VPIGSQRNYFGKRRFARARRSPENYRRKSIAFNQQTQRRISCYKVSLTDNIIKRSRSQPCRKWSLRLQAFSRRSAEQIARHFAAGGKSLMPNSLS
jgi:hypothetical protein